MKIRVTLVDFDREWTYDDPWDYQDDPPDSPPPIWSALWRAENMWTEGNFGCDCNRRMFLCGAHEEYNDLADHLFVYDEFNKRDRFMCGEQVKLVAVDEIMEDGSLSYVWRDGDTEWTRASIPTPAPADAFRLDEHTGLYMPAPEARS